MEKIITIDDDSIERFVNSVELVSVSMSISQVVDKINLLEKALEEVEEKDEEPISYISEEEEEDHDKNEKKKIRIQKAIDSLSDLEMMLFAVLQKKAGSLWKDAN